MQEPLPLPIVPPAGIEPQIRVGLVLEEDTRQELALQIFTSGYQLLSAEDPQPLSAGKYLVSAAFSHVTLTNQETKQIITTAATLTIVAPEHFTLSANSGIQLSPIVAGRKFHWRKEVALTYPGNLEFQVRGTHLLVVNEVGFEAYCTCVIASEMGAACPPAFMQAQAACARSWSLVFLRNKHPGAPYQVCNDDDCQRYQGTTFLSNEVIAAIKASRGLFIVDNNGNTCPAYYSKSCGGFSELPENTFGFSVPGISAVSDSKKRLTADLRNDEQFALWQQQKHAAHHDVFCSTALLPEKELHQYLGAVDEQGSYYRWTFDIGHEELVSILKQRSSANDIAEVLELIPGRRGLSGRLCTLDIRYRSDSGAEKLITINDQFDIRRALHRSFLLSSAFTFQWVANEQQPRALLRFEGAGWGHGVGLCQIGAVSMAKHGYSCEQILKHYFPETKLVNAY